MKKLLVTLIFTFFLYPLVSAQFISPLPGPEALFQEYLQMISKAVKNQQQEDSFSFTQKTIEGEYYTEQQLQPGYEEFKEEDLPKLEKRKTDTYEEITINVPSGYSINKEVDAEGYISFLSQRSSILYATNKSYEDESDISFKLDYDIIFKHPEEIPYTEYYSVKAGKPLTLKIRYSSKYFTWKKADNNYDFSRTTEITYKEKKVTLRTHVVPVLRVTTPSGNTIKYILEPNFQNIYNDFKFVRDGYKESFLAN